MQKYTAVSVCVPRFSLIFSDRCNTEKVCMDNLVINQRMLEGTLKCNFFLLNLIGRNVE